MIVCKDYQGYYTKQENDETKYVVFVGLYTSTAPSTLPQNAVGIENFPQNFDATKVEFGAGSTLFCASTGAIYIADDTGTWQLQ